MRKKSYLKTPDEECMNFFYKKDVFTINENDGDGRMSLQWWSLKNNNF